MFPSWSSVLAGCLAAAPSNAAATPPATAASDEALVAADERHRIRAFEQIAPSVVFLSTSDGFGSGFFVDANGLIVTNAHVVEGHDTVKVVTHGGLEVRGTVVERGADDLDVALVQAPLRHTPPLRFASADAVAVGSWAGAIGHGRGGIWTFNVGIVSNIYPVGRERPVIQTQIPLNPGASGGPVFDRRGRVIGLVVSGLTDANAINFALRSEAIVAGLTKLQPRCNCVVVRAPKGVPVFLDGQMVGVGPKVVRVLEPGEHRVFGVIEGRKRLVRFRSPERRVVDLTQ